MLCMYIMFHVFASVGVPYSSGKHVRMSNTPFKPLLYSEIGIYRGIHNFLIFALKHRLGVLVRTGSVIFEQK